MVRWCVVGIRRESVEKCVVVCNKDVGNGRSIFRERLVR